MTKTRCLDLSRLRAKLETRFSKLAVTEPKNQARNYLINIKVTRKLTKPLSLR